MSRIVLMFPLLLTMIILNHSSLYKIPVSSPKCDMPGALTSDVKVEDAGIYFRANGAEPEWKLTISTDRIEFTSATKGFEKIVTEHEEPIKVMDSNVKKYNVQSKDFHMDIELTQMSCQNTKSMERFPYSVKISIKHGKENDPVIFNGCGLYITNLGLQGKWILHQIKDDTITAAQFKDTIPFVEISTKGNSFTGYGGCNNITGRIFSERNLLRFTDLIISEGSCASITGEKEFINALQFSTNFKIEGNKLFLSNPGGKTLTLIRP